MPRNNFFHHSAAFSAASLSRFLIKFTQSRHLPTFISADFPERNCCKFEYLLSTANLCSAIPCRCIAARIWLLICSLVGTLVEISIFGSRKILFSVQLPSRYQHFGICPEETWIFFWKSPFSSKLRFKYLLTMKCFFRWDFRPETHRTFLYVFLFFKTLIQTKILSVCATLVLLICYFLDDKNVST